MEKFNSEEIMNMLGQTALVAKSNTESTAVILKRLESQENLINGMAMQMDSINNSMVNMNDRMDRLELQEEITTYQVNTIKKTAMKRVIEIIGDDSLEQKKYIRTFIQRLYKDARTVVGLGSAISETRKQDYQRVIDFIEAWIPSCGCSELRLRADKNAKARREAYALGYE